MFELKIDMKPDQESAALTLYWSRSSNRTAACSDRKTSRPFRVKASAGPVPGCRRRGEAPPLSLRLMGSDRKRPWRARGTQTELLMTNPESVVSNQASSSSLVPSSSACSHLHGGPPAVWAAMWWSLYSNIPLWGCETETDVLSASQRTSPQTAVAGSDTSRLTRC